EPGRRPGAGWWAWRPREPAPEPWQTSAPRRRRRRPSPTAGPARDRRCARPADPVFPSPYRKHSAPWPSIQRSERAGGRLKVVLLTREYPPDVYGGAGVHVEYLSRELAKLVPLEVRRFGKDGSPDAAPRVRGFQPWERLAGEAPSPSALEVMSIDLAMAAGLEAPSLVHSHTWYVNFAGHVAKLLYGIPHVATTHSLEPLRPWKAEQLGPGGYALSSFCERTGLEGADGVIAVSAAMRADVLRTYPAIDPSKVEVIHNGIDADEYRPDPGTDVLARYGVDPDRPYALFV